MVVCTYFQQGRCKFGGTVLPGISDPLRYRLRRVTDLHPDRCKFEHPGHVTLGSGNRFGVLSGSSSSGGFGGMSFYLLFSAHLPRF